MRIFLKKKTEKSIRYSALRPRVVSPTYLYTI